MSEKKIIKRLKQIQADSNAMYIKFHGYNWNVEGMNFMFIQNLTEQLHDYMARVFNDSAEQVIQLDEKPYLTLEELCQNRKIKDDKTPVVDFDYVCKQIIRDLVILKEGFADLSQASAGEAETVKNFADENVAYITSVIDEIENAR